MSQEAIILAGGCCGVALFALGFPRKAWPVLLLAAIGFAASIATGAETPAVVYYEPEAGEYSTAAASDGTRSPGAPSTGGDDASSYAAGYCNGPVCLPRPLARLRAAATSHRGPECHVASSAGRRGFGLLVHLHHRFGLVCCDSSMAEAGELVVSFAGSPSAYKGRLVAIDAELALVIISPPQQQPAAVTKLRHSARIAAMIAAVLQANGQGVQRTNSPAAEDPHATAGDDGHQSDQGPPPAPSSPAADPRPAVDRPSPRATLTPAVTEQQWLAIVGDRDHWRAAAADLQSQADQLRHELETTKAMLGECSHQLQRAVEQMQPPADQPRPSASPAAIVPGAASTWWKWADRLGTAALLALGLASGAGGAITVPVLLRKAGLLAAKRAATAVVTTCSTSPRPAPPPPAPPAPPPPVITTSERQTATEYIRVDVPDPEGDFYREAMRRVAQALPEDKRPGVTALMDQVEGVMRQLAHGHHVQRRAKANGWKED